MDPQIKTVGLQPLIGRKVKHFQVDQVLGQGGMGIVYRAHDLKLDRAVALKFLPSDVTGDADRRKRFQLEARAAARINHPAIAQIYDVDEHEGALFIAMEWVEGKTVRQLIKDRELDLLGAIDLAIQVAGGLAKAHDIGIVHRDIKPGNVMRTPDGHAKILDFGLAKLLQPNETVGAATDLTTLTQTQSGAIKGTPAYMSPEQVRGEPADARSDIFSLGVMLCESVTGRNPFHRGTFWETLQAVAFDDTPVSQGSQIPLSPGLERIITRCLQKNPDSRYPDARALLHDLKALRRDTELGRMEAVPIKERFEDLIEHAAHLNRAQLTWLAAAVLATAAIVYLLVTDTGMGGILAWLLVSIILFRRFRNEPHRLRDRFVRKISKIPEVRLITCRDNQWTVIIDRPTGQLYTRINRQLNECNRKLTFGKSFTAAIQHDLPEAELRQLLNSPGVQYMRNEPGKLRSKQ